MSLDELPVPDYQPVASPDGFARLPELVGELCQRLGDMSRRLEMAEQQAREQFATQNRKMNRLVAQLASERFELERLLRRVLPELEAAGLANLAKVLTLYARSWDSNLQRAEIEVRDVTGCELTDELVEVVEVESAVADASVRQTVVRETITPLVIHQGRVIGVATIITAVPVSRDELSCVEAL
jgi:hypothetical protein